MAQRSLLNLIGRWSRRHGLLVMESTNIVTIYPSGTVLVLVWFRFVLVVVESRWRFVLVRRVRGRFRCSMWVREFPVPGGVFGGKNRVCGDGLCPVCA